MARESPVELEVTERHARIRRLIEDTARRRLNGEAVSDEGIVATHPELMPELADALFDLSRVEAARGAAASGSSSNGYKDGVGGPTRPRMAVPSFPGYEIRELVHRGGQGIVYRAIQKSTHREVALKVMKEGPFADDHDKARFDREVRILASLNHPNIVAIHDSGEAAGHFYFVMDFIEGKALNDYVKNAETSKRPNAETDPLPIALCRLPIEVTLRLFAKIGEAVNAAHLRGIIHRDLKPSNILVDARGEPHILDFGLAKLTPDSIGNWQSAIGNLPTVTGQFIGTLPWASPEQVAGNPDNIDIRTDVYSLGVLLYHSLTGHFPYEVVGQPHEVTRNIAQVEPLRPRSTGTRIDDDVETIVLKCLHKECERRYQSAGELARDIGHYLTGELIEAKRDSRRYLLKKILRRYRFAASVAAAFVALATMSSVALTVLYFRAKNAEGVAIKTRDVLVSMFELPDPLQFPGVTAQPPVAQVGSTIDARSPADRITARMILERGTQRVLDDLVNHPTAQADLLNILGRIYRNLGAYDQSKRALESALEIREKTLGPEHADIATSLNNLGVTLKTMDDLEGAASFFRRALEMNRKVFGEGSPEVTSNLSNLGSVLQQYGDNDEAIRVLTEAVRRNRTSGPKREGDLAFDLNNLASAFSNMGRYDDAARLLRESIQIRRRLLGDDHPDVTSTLTNLGMVLSGLRRFEEATLILREALESERRRLGDEHPDVGTTYYQLGRVQVDGGDLAAAEQSIGKALDILGKSKGKDTYEYALAQGRLALILQRTNRCDQAMPLLDEAVGTFRRTLREIHPRIANVLILRAECLLNASEYEKTETDLIDALRILKAQSNNAATSETAKVEQKLVQLYEVWGKPEQAAQWRGKAKAKSE